MNGDSIEGGGTPSIQTQRLHSQFVCEEALLLLREYKFSAKLRVTTRNGWLEGWGLLCYPPTTPHLTPPIVGGCRIGNVALVGG